MHALRLTVHESCYHQVATYRPCGASTPRGLVIDPPAGGQGTMGTTFRWDKAMADAVLVLRLPTAEEFIALRQSAGWHAERSSADLPRRRWVNPWGSPWVIAALLWVRPQSRQGIPRPQPTVCAEGVCIRGNRTPHAGEYPRSTVCEPRTTPSGRTSRLESHWRKPGGWQYNARQIARRRSRARSTEKARITCTCTRTGWDLLNEAEVA